MDTIEKERLADDILYGAAEIARFIGVSEMQVYHLARKKRIPVGKLGKTLVASRRALKRALTQLTS